MSLSQKILLYNDKLIVIVYISVLETTSNENTLLI